MPTIIDSLIVSLSLDPKGFNASQKNSVAALNSLEDHARGIQKTLNDLGNQSRRTGSSVAAGASAGAVGLRNLAVAGVETYAAFKTLEGIIGKVTDASQRGAKLSRDAWALGMPTQKLDTMMLAAYETAHVPQEAFKGALDSYQQKIETNKRKGDWANEFTEAQMLGIHTDAPMLQQLKEIRAALQGKQGPETENWVNAMGLSPLLHWLKLSQTQVDAAEKISARHALTDDQGKELEHLQNAAAKYEDSMVHLWETISADFSKSGLSQALGGFSALIDSTSKNESAMKALEIATEVVAVGGVLTLTSALWKLVAAMNGVWAAPLVRLLVASRLGPVGAFLAAFWPTETGNKAEVDAEKKLFDESKRRNGTRNIPGRPLPDGGWEAPIPGIGANTGTGYPFPVQGDANRPQFPNLPAPSGNQLDAGPGLTTNTRPFGITNDNGEPIRSNIPAPRSENRPLNLPWDINRPIAQRQSALSTIRANSADRVTQSNTDIATNIGQIMIHLKDDAVDVGSSVFSAIKDTIRKNTMISSANSGMDG